MMMETKNHGDIQEKQAQEIRPDILLYSDLYKNAMMSADASARMVGKTSETEETSPERAVLHTELRQEITQMMEGYSGFAQKAANALGARGVTAEQLTALEKLPAEIGITVQTMFDKSVSKCAEIMISGITMCIMDMKKARRVCAEEGCSPDACRLADDMLMFCERYVERMKEFL